LVVAGAAVAAAPVDEEESINPGDLLTAALESDDVSDSDLRDVDKALDRMMSSAGAKGEPLLSLEEAQAKISPEILEVLAIKFKGSLTQVRHIDERDQMF
jgi:hypothetical protein